MATHPVSLLVRTCLWLTFAALLVACAPRPLPATTPPPTPSAFSGVTAAPGSPQARIAFASNRAGDWEIYEMNPDGSGLVRLTNASQSDEFFPRYSRDGRSIMYWSHTESPPRAELWQILPDGSSRIFMEKMTAWFSFSPDGQSVVFSTLTPGFEDELSIFAWPRSAAEPMQLTKTPGDDFQPAWSPDGKTIAFTSARLLIPQVYLMDPDGSHQRRLTDNAFSEMEPAWSPDGSTIAFVGDISDTASSIFLVNADGTNTRPLTQEGSGLNANPAWSSDGERIAFWSNRTGNADIYSVRLDGTGLTNLTNHPAGDENPAWSP